MRGTLRWARADLRARRGQALITVAVVAGVVAALFLATMLLQGAVNPWQQLFARTRGADVLIYFHNGTNTNELRHVTGIKETGQPYQAAPATLERGAVKSPVELRAMTQEPPAMSAPLVVTGTWLRSSAQDGAVIEASFAQAAGVGVGDWITVDGIDGTRVPMRVIGIADTADQGFYPQWTPGLIWVQHGLLTRVEANPGETLQIVGLRLFDNSTVATGQVVQTIWNLYNGPAENSASAVERYSTWQQVKDSMANNDRLLGLLLALFGIIALLAAPCAIANVTAGRVLVQRQDIAMLKALGFTPGQVVRMLLAEQTLLGAAGAALGLAAARIITSPAFVKPPGGTPVGLAPLSGAWIALIGAGTVLTVAVATVIPAWWAGRVSPVAAVQPSPPRGHLSLITRLSLLFHLPAALVLGARDSLTRRLSAGLTVFGLAIPMAMITIALTCWSTIDGFTSDPGKIGLASAVTVSQGGLESEQMLALIGHDAQVLAAYPGAQSVTLLPGDNGTFYARAMGTSTRPYPFRAVQGRMFRAANEAVAGQGFLDLMHIGVGAWISPTIDGVPVILHIVGRTIEPDNNGDVLDFGLDALDHAGSAPPQTGLPPGPEAGRDGRRGPGPAARRVARPARRADRAEPGQRPGGAAAGDRGLGGHPGRDRAGQPAHRHRGRDAGSPARDGRAGGDGAHAAPGDGHPGDQHDDPRPGRRHRRHRGRPADRAAADQHAGRDERHRLGYRGQPEPGGDRGHHGRGAGHRRGRGPDPGPPHHQAATQPACNAPAPPDDDQVKAADVGTPEPTSAAWLSRRRSTGSVAATWQMDQGLPVQFRGSG